MQSFDTFSLTDTKFTPWDAGKRLCDVFLCIQNGPAL